MIENLEIIMVYDSILGITESRTIQYFVSNANKLWIIITFLSTMVYHAVTYEDFYNNHGSLILILVCQTHCHGQDNG